MKIALQLLAILALSVGGLAHAEHHKGKPHPPVSKEDREKMAVNFDKMAACLRTDAGVDKCHEEMNAGMKASGCPMMGNHGEGHHPKAK